jgi:hypothetical protein
MANHNTEALADLATEAMVQSITPPVQEQQADVPPCDVSDKACTKRWLDSLSDCC